MQSGANALAKKFLEAEPVVGVYLFIADVYEALLENFLFLRPVK